MKPAGTRPTRLSLRTDSPENQCKAVGLDLWRLPCCPACYGAAPAESFIENLHPEPKKPKFAAQIIPAEWLMPLPAGFPPEKSGQFFNLITAWDLLGTTRVNADDWLAATAGNSTVCVMLLQFAKARGINVVSIVRERRGDLGELGT
jgi:hypothetical protein